MQTGPQGETEDRPTRDHPARPESVAARRITMRRPYAGPGSGLFAPLACDLLREGLSLSFSARGHSMVPFIHDGDTVTVVPVLKHPLPLGSIVLHTTHLRHSLLAHRIVWKQRKGEHTLYWIRGDAFWLRVDRVPEGAVLGVVVLQQHGKRATNPNTHWRRTGGLLRAWTRSLRARILVTVTKRRPGIKVG